MQGFSGNPYDSLRSFGYGNRFIGFPLSVQIAAFNNPKGGNPVFASFYKGHRDFGPRENRCKLNALVKVGSEVDIDPLYMMGFLHDVRDFSDVD